jgi:hypothetical protein
MKNPDDSKAVNYWKYLEENSKAVSEFPGWLKGQRRSESNEQDRASEDETPPNSGQEKLAS